jgi:hypothetical protein
VGGRELWLQTRPYSPPPGLKAGFFAFSAQISVQKYCAFDARQHSMTIRDDQKWLAAVRTSRWHVVLEDCFSWH